MKTDDREAPLAELAAQVLAGDEPTHLPRSLDHRASQIAALERALRARARFRWLRAARGGVAVAAAAAAILMVWLAWRPAAPPAGPIVAPSPGPRSSPVLASVDRVTGPVEVGGIERDLAAGDEIAPGTRLRVRSGGGLALRLNTGTRLGLTGGASMRVADRGPVSRFELDAGAFTAEVAKLDPGRRFVVATPDAEVEVRGTRFQVVVAPAPGPCDPLTRTTVVVDEGVVVVRFGARELQVAAGQRWPECPAAGPAAAGPAHRVDRSRARRHAVKAAAGAALAQPAAPTSAPSSTLAEQNDLLAAALTAERRGALDEAERWLDRLVSLYPDGQLADSARAQRRRLAGLRAGKAPGR